MISVGAMSETVTKKSAGTRNIQPLDFASIRALPTMSALALSPMHMPIASPGTAAAKADSRAEPSPSSGIPKPPINHPRALPMRAARIGLVPRSSAIPAPMPPKMIVESSSGRISSSGRACSAMRTPMKPPSTRPEPEAIQRRWALSSLFARITANAENMKPPRIGVHSSSPSRVIESLSGPCGLRSRFPWRSRRSRKPTA